MTYQQIVSVTAAAFPLTSPFDKPSLDSRYVSLREQLRATYAISDETVHYSNAFQLLVAAILLPQATVSEVNQVTPALFVAYPTTASLVTARRRDIEKLIRAIGFYRQKAKYLQLTSQILLSEHDGNVPKTLANLTRLPGVARKAANLIMTELYDEVSGVMVDTRVKRVAQRLGIADGKSAEAIENDLMRLMPQEDWLDMPQRMVALADSVCGIRKPRCADCPLKSLCPSSTA